MIQDIYHEFLNMIHSVYDLRIVMDCIYQVMTLSEIQDMEDDIDNELEKLEESDPTKHGNTITPNLPPEREDIEAERLIEFITPKLGQIIHNQHEFEIFQIHIFVGTHLYMVSVSSPFVA